MSSYERAPVLAVDIGGTKIMTAVVSAGGSVRAVDIVPTEADEGVQAVISRLFTLIDSLLERHSLEINNFTGIGIACAGGVDTALGVITQSPNLPDWHDIPLADYVREKYRMEAYVINDASAAALGEHRCGAGVGADNLVMVTLGTGIGGGIVINDELYLGARGSAAEIGHMIIDTDGPACRCGSSGCWEQFASGTAVARNARERIKAGGKTALIHMVDRDIEAITSEHVGDAARAGDALSLDVLSWAAYYLGIGLVNLVNIFNPEMIIIGGGLAGQLDFMMGPAREIVDARAFKMAAGTVSIVPAQLGNEAGVYGAAAYVFDRAKRRPK